MKRDPSTSACVEMRLQYLRNGQVSPRLGATHKYDQSNVFRVLRTDVHAAGIWKLISFYEA